MRYNFPLWEKVDSKIARQLFYFYIERCYHIFMNSKALVWIGATVGSVVGGLIPSLWGADIFSLAPLVFGSIGAIIGIYLGFKLSN